MSCKRTYFCGHCSTELSKTVYFQHRKQFFDRKTKQWCQSRVYDDCLGEDFDFDEDPSSSGPSESNDTGALDVFDSESLEHCDSEFESCEDVHPEPDSSDSEPDFCFDDENDVEIWISQDDDLCDTATTPQHSYVHHRLVEAYVKFLFLWQAIFRVSDVGIGVLLSFIATFISLVGRLFSIESLAKLGTNLPKSLYSAQKVLGCNSDSFVKFVCCPKCSSLYTIDRCIITNRDGSKVSNTCTFVRYPNHRNRCQRNPCGTRLMKTVRTAAGTTYLYPRQLYCYKSVIEALKEKVCLPNFVKLCEEWRGRTAQDGVYKDIHDGKVWKEFLKPGNIPFLSLPYNYGLCLNVDWFQPFKHSQYSCGALYLSVLNLPRSERYCTENVILLGIIPGPKEPELTINSFLEPFVKELLELWDGVLMRTNSNTVLVRAALLCVACDIPAARKVCGFTGHNSLHACSKCGKMFPTAVFGEKPDYRGFDRADWPSRSLESHKFYAYKHREAPNKTAQKQIEREHGCRYSVLLQLPYFDPVRMCIVDPMHNLLLGTAKHVLSVWKELDLITSQQFEVIQEKVDSFTTPDDVGRIPTKIAAGFSGFKAEQWRNWTLLFSLYSLKGVIPYPHYNCWQLFVKACHLLCRRTITTRQIQEADQLLIEFCEAFESLYGKDHCNINLHLHGHLCDCLNDFGPIYAFWLFPFERLNGVLGSFHTNCHDISLQLMRRYLRTNEFRTQAMCSEFREDFLPLINKCIYDDGSLRQSCLEVALQCVNNVEPLPPVSEGCLPPDQRKCLVSIISQLHDEPAAIDVLSIFQKCSSLRVGGFLLGSMSGRHHLSSIAFSYSLDSTERPKLVRVHYFANISYIVKQGENEILSSIWIARVNFFLEHPCRVWFGYPTEVWTSLESSESSFVPLFKFCNRVAYTLADVSFGRIIGTHSVFVAVPV